MFLMPEGFPNEKAFSLESQFFILSSFCAESAQNWSQCSVCMCCPKRYNRSISNFFYLKRCSHVSHILCIFPLKRSHILTLKIKNFIQFLWLCPGVGNDFFPGGPGGNWALELRGYQGVDFGTQKLTNLDQNSKISLI